MAMVQFSVDADDGDDDGDVMMMSVASARKRS